ncbi:A-kinase anchor protein 9 isoform X3 [Megalops cyprinoides]|uniref:A-kinase anchor protein 9 isoform X3 n=1 Tax=Megalops cyprinoides TaxID=118141 RepID=UPI001864AF92|nr:A-kinase anchor protein 9 isoform X3 [Megalops cyprinoides]
MEDEERQKKLEAGKAKLAEYRQRKAEADGQKKAKKKRKVAGAKGGGQAPDEAERNQSPGEEKPGSGTDPPTTEFTFARTLRSGETVKHDQTYTIEPESEVSTTAEDCSSEVNGRHERTENAKESSKDLVWEEDMCTPGSSEHQARGCQARLQIMEEELAEKKQTIEELNKELAELRAAFGTEGVQQLQDFEAAIKQRDGIITQLTANLQQARHEKDEVMKEFLEMTEQSQKLQIQFQQLQAGESLRNSSHSSTAADLLQAKQHILSYQQQLEERDAEVKCYQEKTDDHLLQISQLQHSLSQSETNGRTQEESFAKRLNEKDALIVEQETTMVGLKRSLDQLKEELAMSDKSLNDLKAEIAEKNQELESCQAKLAVSRQKERQSSSEIQQLMGTVEDLQRRSHSGSWAESERAQCTEVDFKWKMEQLRAGLDEMYGQQIVQMKQELCALHSAETDRLKELHRSELTLAAARASEKSSQLDALHINVSELRLLLEEAQTQRERVRQDLAQVSDEKLSLQRQVEDLLQQLRSERGRAGRSSQSISQQELQQSQIRKLQEIICDLEAQLAATREANRELETKHESEVTNYQIKLDMLEREKDAVLDRMAESQEAELERLRTHLLFSHEEELAKLREDLQRENLLSMESLREELALRHEQVLESLQKGLEGQLQVAQREKESLATERDVLVHEITVLREDLNQSVESSKSQNLSAPLKELQLETEKLGKGESKKRTLEKDIQELLRKNELLEKEVKEKEESWEHKRKELEFENIYLKEANKALEEEMKSMTVPEKVVTLGAWQSIEALTGENQQLSRQLFQLKEEIEKQKNTFSFAEKNFEVNYQELKDEFTCLVNIKGELEEKLLKVTVDYETKLSSLQLHIGRLEERRRKDLHEDDGKAGKMVEDFIEGGELIGKDTMKLMEKLEMAEREKSGLALRLSEVSEQLMLKESQVEHLEGELKQAELEKQAMEARNRELEGWCMAVSASGGGVASLGSYSIQDYQRQIQLSQGMVSALQSSLQTAERERDSIQQQLATLAQPAERTLDRGGGRWLGSVELPGREQGGKEEEGAAEWERSTPRSPQPKQMQPATRKQVENVRGCGLECESDPVMGQRGMDHIQQGEFRLQMEAQRISLSQIYSAQLELLRDSQRAETDACLRKLEQELRSSHAQELQSLRDRHQQELCNLKGQHSDSRSSRYQNVIQMVSEECSQLFMSFAKILGEDYLELLQHKELEEETNLGIFSDVTKENIKDPRSLLHVAKALYADLQFLKERIVQECNRLQDLQSLLNADRNKLVLLQEAYDELKSASEEETTRLRSMIDSSPSRPQDLSGLQEMERLKAEFQQQQARLEQQHSQEMQHMRAHYEQQAKDSEQRYAAELILLQQRLQELMVSEYLSRLPSESLFSEQREEDSEEFKLEDAGVDTELKQLAESAGLAQELQALHRALYKKYLEEVSALKEQHCRELQRLEEQLSQETQAPKPHCESINGGVRSIEGRDPLPLIHALEKQHKEKVEEEIAKVIVQMSVEFAQQSELARLAKQAREMTSAMQTQADDLGGVSVLGVEERERGLVAEKERLERELKERTAEILSLREQLYQAGAPPGSLCQVPGHAEGSALVGSLQRPSITPGLTERVAGPKYCLEGDEEKVKRESVLLWGRVPEMQSSSMQTEQDESQGKEAKSELPPQCAGQPDFSPDVITAERNLLRKANESLRQVLSDVLKTTAATEETIGRHVEGILDMSTREQQTQRPTWQRVATEPFGSYSSQTTAPGGGVSPDSCHGSGAGGDDASVWSGGTVTDEGLEMSQQLMDSLLGVELRLENEEYLMSVSSRLQAAVEKLLVAITKTTIQLEHARVTQTELMRESFRHNEEITELLHRQEELQDRLAEEARAREKLALELHRAEGVIDGYTEERAALEEQLREKQDLQLQLEQELQVTGSRLQELDQERQQMQQERELLARQQVAMKDTAGSRELRLVEAAIDAAPEADLLEETEKLMKEKVEVQRQAEKENSDLLKQVKELEAELEEQVNRVIELEQAQRAESSDLRQQIQALEKQLEKNRRFLDEQAVDREHERDVFQQEIAKLELQLKNPQKQQLSADQNSREVEQLTAQLKEKSDLCSELLLGSEQLQRDVQERNEEIEKLEACVRELEQALLISTESLHKVEERRLQAPTGDSVDTTLEAQLQTEREALDRKEKEISNLEEQLEQFREELENKSEDVQQLHMQLEIQRKALSTQEQDLEHKGDLLKVMEEKDREIALLNEQLSKIQQMEMAPDNKVIEEKSEMLRELEYHMECMKSEQERLKKNSEEEIDQLNDVIEKLQQELAKIEYKASSEDPHDSADPEARQEVQLSKGEFHEVKQKMDQATHELNTLRAHHCCLEEKYKRLQKEASDALAGREKWMGLEEALLEKTAACTVMQAQMQALEQSASSRVAELSARLEHLEACVEERDSDLRSCRRSAEEAQAEAMTLQCKISELEDRLREEVAAVLVSQAQLGAVQQYSEAKGQTKEQQRDASVTVEGTISCPGVKGVKNSVTKVVLLTEKLRELEVSLSDMQKDQELQKQLLSRSEKEVLEYEKRLAVLMNLLNQMTTMPKIQRPTLSMEALVRVGEKDPAGVSEILRDLQQVREEAAATKEELNSYRDRSAKLQEELEVRDVSLAQLQDKLQERERTIVHLKENLQQGSQQAGKEDPTSVSEILQDLQKVREEAAATKEELSSCQEHSGKLLEELQQVRKALAKSEEELSLLMRKKGGKHLGEKQDNAEKARGVSTKEKPTLAKKDSTSQTERPTGQNRNREAQHTVCADAGVQVNLLQPHGHTSEEVMEVIVEYREKIGQMQDLHAAEIMDMETRHISESEALRKDVQTLQDECATLKAVIDKLYTSEAIPTRLEQPATLQFKDGYTSDSSSDWSQRVGCDLPAMHEFRTTPEGARRDNETDVLPERIKSLLREVHQEGMQVLCLSEMPAGEGEEACPQLQSQGWAKERAALLASVESLKALISKMQVLGGSAEEGVDWRAELLKAVQQVFVKDRSVLKSSLYSHLELLDTSDAVVHLNQVEHILAEQDAQHREAMGIVQSADRTSLVMEVQQLRAQLQLVQQDSKLTGSIASPLAVTPDPGAGELQGPQERRAGPVFGLGTQSSSGVACDSDRMLLDELKSELAQTKLELETTLKAQHKQLKELETLRTEVTERAGEVDALSDKLADEQRKSRELQWALEKERCKLEKKKGREREEVEDLRLALEEQQARVAWLSEAVEQERGATVQQQSCAAELRVQLESAQTRTLELASALERERELHARFRWPQDQQVAAAGMKEAEAGCSQVEEGVRSVETLLEMLQTQLEEKHARVVQLVGEVERSKLEVVQAQMERDRERQAVQIGQEHLQQLQARADELHTQLDREKQQALQLQEERDHLQDIVAQLQGSTLQRGGARDTAWTQQTSDQNQQLAPWQVDGEPSNRTRDWVLKQKIAAVLTVDSSAPSLQAGAAGSGAPSDPGLMDSVMHSLQLIATKIKTLTANAAGRTLGEDMDREGLAWLQNSVQSVVSLLQQTPALPPAPESSGPVGSSSSSLMERLLRQNAELTGFVSRLTEEKNDLRNSLIKLEEELRPHRHRALEQGDYPNRRAAGSQYVVQTLHSSEREAWAREKARLEKALQQAEEEALRLRGEICVDSLRDITGSDTDGTALKSIYGKYLRAESFRKALIYQKKYLLLLLGGFQECEEATLALIARMGGQPSHASLEAVSRRRRGFTRFRSAVRVSIALSRMRFLVRRWHKAAGSSTSSVSRNGLSQIPGGEVRTDSLFLHAGNVEMYGERRGVSRGRTGRDSPRSTLSLQHRFHTSTADPGSLTCSHLQNYDPDRALTDYISRLEALQRRLGNVQSGSSYAQLHFGIRR